MGNSFIDMAGQVFGKLTVLERGKSTFTKGGKLQVMWTCKCECGTIRDISGKALRNGSNRSCGCGEYVRELKLTPMERLYSLKRYEASRRNLEFPLTPEAFVEIVSKHCYYCNLAPDLKHNMIRQNDKVTIVYNGIDRVDNAIGYQYSNCVPCCAHCNQMKLHYSLDQFREKIRTVYKHFVEQKVSK